MFSWLFSTAIPQETKKQNLDKFTKTTFQNFDEIKNWFQAQQSQKKLISDDLLKKYLNEHDGQLGYTKTEKTKESFEEFLLEKILENFVKNLKPKHGTNNQQSLIKYLQNHPNTFQKLLEKKRDEFLIVLNKLLQDPKPTPNDMRLLRQIFKGKTNYIYNYLKDNQRTEGNIKKVVGLTFLLVEPKNNSFTLLKDPNNSLNIIKKSLQSTNSQAEFESKLTVSIHDLSPTQVETISLQTGVKPEPLQTGVVKKIPEPPEDFFGVANVVLKLNQLNQQQKLTKDFKKEKKQLHWRWYLLPIKLDTGKVKRENYPKYPRTQQDLKSFLENPNWVKYYKSFIAQMFKKLNKDPELTEYLQSSGDSKIVPLHIKQFKPIVQNKIKSDPNLQPILDFYERFGKSEPPSKPQPQSKPPSKPQPQSKPPQHPSKPQISSEWFDFLLPKIYIPESKWKNIVRED